jgi:multiple sugar transport system ATP-binding protein
VREPRLFLFDEPLSNLDAALRAATRLELARLHRDLGATMVYVTHDQVEAMTLADTIVLLRPLSDGKRASIAQVGAPLDLYHRPADRFVAGFIGSPAMNFLPAEVSHIDPGGVGMRVGALALTASARADTVERGAQVTLGIRPEHVRLGGTLRGEAVHVEHLGEHSIVHVRIAGGHLLQAKTAREDIARGDSLALDLPADALHVFDAEGRALTRL